MKSWILFTTVCLPYEKSRFAHGFNCAESNVKKMTDFFETRVKKFENNEDKNKFPAPSKYKATKKESKKRKSDDSDLAVMKLREDTYKLQDCNGDINMKSVSTTESGL